ncbi:MAG: MOSC N-terminal beta barrel domain-containing protein [Gemmatimonas sp.]
MTPRVAALFVHPLKSAAAIAVNALALDDRGAVADRRWLVIDDDGMQITARETPALALVRPTFCDVGGHEVNTRNVDGPLWLDAPGLSRLRLAIPTTSATRIVQVWKDRVDAQDMGDEVAGWMSDALSRPCRVVRLADQAHRPLAAKYAGPLPHVGRRVAFSDGAPLLILGQASVDALNARLVEQGGDVMSASRFRPNVLLANTTAHEEDTWSRIRIGEVVLGVGSPCERCVMTTIDPITGEQGVEPLRMLSTYRRQNGPVMFGMNATHEQPGTIHVGDFVSL